MRYLTANGLGIQGNRAEARGVNKQRKRKMSRVLGSHTRSTFWAFRGLDVVIEPGDALVVVGRNKDAAGSFLRCACGLLPPTEGSISCEGGSLFMGQLKMRTIRSLSVRQVIIMLCGLYGMTDKETARRFDAIVSVAQIEDKLHLRMEDCSRAARQQVLFAIGLSSSVNLLAISGDPVVGEPGFRKNCIPLLNESKANGQALILDTRKVPIIEELGTKAVILGRKSSNEVSVAEAVAHLDAERQKRRRAKRRAQE
jgi:ABC-type polysaccharide/polyol phosphate transport system ATPase subunit